MENFFFCAVIFLNISSGVVNFGMKNMPGLRRVQQDFEKGCTLT